MTWFVMGIGKRNCSELSVDDVKDGALYMPVPQTAFSQNDLMIQNAFWASKMK